MPNNESYRIAFKNNATGAIHKGNVIFNTEDEAETYCNELNEKRFMTLKALGEYIIFIDSDDYIELDLLKQVDKNIDDKESKLLTQYRINCGLDYEGFSFLEAMKNAKKFIIK